MSDKDAMEWRLYPTGHPGDLAVGVLPESLPEIFDADWQLEWWEDVVVVPKSRAERAEAEVERLREDLDGLVRAVDRYLLGKHPDPTGYPYLERAYALSAIVDAVRLDALSSGSTEKQ